MDDDDDDDDGWWHLVLVLERSFWILVLETVGLTPNVEPADVPTVVGINVDLGVVVGDNN